MKDQLFVESMKLFFLNPSVVLFSIGPLTVLIFLIVTFTVIKKWGESY